MEKCLSYVIALTSALTCASIILAFFGEVPLFRGNNIGIMVTSYLTLISSLIFIVIMMGYLLRACLMKRSDYGKLGSMHVNQSFRFQLLMFRIAPMFPFAIGIVLTSMTFAIWEEYDTSKISIIALCFTAFVPPFLLFLGLLCYSIGKGELW